VLWDGVGLNTDDLATLSLDLWSVMVAAHVCEDTSNKQPQLVFSWPVERHDLKISNVKVHARVVGSELS
jgi:hypothetical protein